jgi:alkylation response protein AidB-like acyl-CoA dehydrogenase
MRWAVLGQAMAALKKRSGRARRPVMGTELMSNAAAAKHENALDRLLTEVRARRAEFSAQRRLPDDIVERLREMGVYRALVARRFGGDERRPSDVYRLIEQIAAVDGSTGWVASFTHVASYLSALPVATLEQIYAQGPDVVVAGGLYPIQSAERVDGGFRVSGRWQFASGCMSASLICVGIKPEGSADELPRLAVLPRDQVTIAENWDVTGLKGTGSHDLVVDNVVVPKEWTFPRGGPPSLDIPLYRFPTISITAQLLASVGVARGALDAVISLAGGPGSITGAPRLAERAYVQSGLAEAEAALRSARAFLHQTADEAYDCLVAGGELDLRQKTLLRLSATHAARTGTEVARRVQSMSGTAGIYAHHPIAEAVQDAQVVPQHVFLSEGTWQSAGRVLLGLETVPGFP